MKKSVFAVLVLTGGAVALAQPTAAERELLTLVEGTTFVISHRNTKDGEPSSCGLEFSVVTRDNSTKQGAPVILSGSYFIHLINGPGLGYMLKLGVRDGFDARTKPTRPHLATIRSPSGKAVRHAFGGAAEDPGYALYGGPLADGALQVYEAIVAEKSFVVGFNRSPGQQDVNVKVDLTVKDSRAEGEKMVRDRSPEMVDEFVSCSGSLIDAARQALGQPSK